MAASDERLKGLSSRAANTVERALVACLHIDLYTTVAQAATLSLSGSTTSDIWESNGRHTRQTTMFDVNTIDLAAIRHALDRGHT